MDSTALQSYSKEVAVGMQRTTGHSDCERLIQGNSHNLSLEYIPQVSKDPDTLQEALSQDDWDRWIEAIEAEFDAFSANEMWCVVELPKGRKAMDNKWIFKVKANSDGTIERF